MSNARPTLVRVLRFGLAGLANTIIGLILVYALDLGLHMQPAGANAIGYGVCVVLGFMMSRSFVFQNKFRVSTTGGRYLVVILAAFLLNQAVLRVALAILGDGVLQHAAAQLAGMVVYTGFTFLGCQLWVFRSSPGKS